MEKICKVCQFRADTAETVCPECGAPLYEVTVEPAAVPAEDGVAAKRMRQFRRIHLPWGAAIALFFVVCLALEGGLLWLTRPPELRFIPASENWCHLVQWPTGAAFITADNVTTTRDLVFPSSFSSDRSRMLTMKWESLEDSESAYYLWDGAAVEKYAKPAALSGNGRCLFYQKEKDIFRKNLDAGTEEVIDQTALLPDYPYLFPSWDGTAVAYYTSATEDKSTLRLWTEADGVEEIEVNGGMSGLNVGAQGKTLMTYGYSAISSFFSGGGASKSQVLWRDTGRVTDLGGTYTCNRDGTEWLYTGPGTELTYDDGSEPIPLGFKKETWMCRPENGRSVDHLKEWFYRTQDELYFLDDRLSMELLAEKVEDVAVDAAGRWLYYVSEGDVYRIDDPTRPWRKTVQLTDRLAGDVEVGAYTLDVAPDGESMTYFASADEESVLQRISSDGTVWPSLDATPTSFVSLNGGVMWAVTQEGELVYAKGDGEFQTVMEDPIFATRGILEASPAGDQAILTYIADDGSGRIWRLTADGEAESLLKFGSKKGITNILWGRNIYGAG